MTPDLYAAWLTAGDRLQPVVAWATANWNALAAFTAAALLLAVIAWAGCGDDYRTRNDRRAASWAAVDGRPEPGEPGSNDDDLRTCQLILAATETAEARKEDGRG